MRKLNKNFSENQYYRAKTETDLLFGIDHYADTVWNFSPYIVLSNAASFKKRKNSAVINWILYVWHKSTCSEYQVMKPITLTNWFMKRTYISSHQNMSNFFNVTCPFNTSSVVSLYNFLYFVTLSIVWHILSLVLPCIYIWSLIRWILASLLSLLCPVTVKFSNPSSHILYPSNFSWSLILNKNVFFANIFLKTFFFSHMCKGILETILK